MATLEVKCPVERYRKHDWIERAGHWIHVVNVVLLVLSGLQIHFPQFRVFGTIENARTIHFVSMYMFLFIGVLHVYFFFALGKHRIAMFSRSDIRDVIPTLKWYLFLSDERPDYVKYNVLQKASYGALFVVSALQALLGFSMYWYDKPVFDTLVVFFGGLEQVRAYHYLLSWVFISFTMVHLYLIVFEDIRLFSAMITGYYFRKATRESGT